MVKKRGYLTTFKNYKEWYMSHDAFWQVTHMVKCEHCGKLFRPNSPNQKFCGADENPDCYNARHDVSLANGNWVNFEKSNTLLSYSEKNNK